MIDKEECLRSLEKMSRNKFESICIRLLESMGFEVSDIKSISGDILAEGKITKKEKAEDYVIKCTRSGGEVNVEIESLKKMITPKSRGLLLTTEEIYPDKILKMDKIEVAGGEKFYRLLEKFDLLTLVEEKVEDGGGWLIREGDRYLEEGDHKQALDHYNQAITEEKDPALAFYKKGMIYYEKNSLNEAEEALHDSLEIDPENPEAWTRLGHIYYRKGEKEKAVEAYDKALDYDEDHLEAWKSKGRALRDLEMYDEAIMSFDRILEIEPKDYKSWNEKGLCHMKKREYKEALDCVNSALTIQPYFEEAMLNKALVFEKLGKIKQALDMAEKLVKSDPKKAEYHYINGAYLEKMGEEEEAWESIQRSLQLDPEHEGAQELHFILQDRLGKDETSTVVEDEKRRITSEDIEEEIEIAAEKTGIEGMLNIKSKGDGKFELEIDDKSDEISGLRKKKEDLERKLEEKENEIEELSKELGLIKERMEEKEKEIEEKIQDESERAEELREREKKLGRKLEEKDEKIKKLEDEKAELRKKMKDEEYSAVKEEDLREEIEEMEENLDQLVGERENLKNRLEKKEAEVKKRDKKIEDLKDELQKKEKKIKEIKSKSEPKTVDEEEISASTSEERSIYGNWRRIREASMMWRIDECEQAIKIAPKIKEERALNIIGCCFYDQGDLDSAEDMFKDARPYDVSYMNLEEIYFQQKRYKEGSKLIESFDEENSFHDTVPFLEKNAETLRRSGNFEKAIDYLEKAEELEEESLIDFILSKARCEVYVNDWSDGIEILDESKEENDSPLILDLLSVFQYKERNFSEGFEILDDLIDRFEKNPRLFNNLACFAAKLEAFDEAIKLFEEALESKTDDAVFLNNFGFCQLELNMVEDALQTFERAVELNEDDAVGWYNRGLALKRLEMEDWEESIKKAVELYPEFKEAKKMLEG